MMIENKIYNPAGQPKEWLIEHFVVRTSVFDKIFKDISTGKMKYPEQHYIIQGQRGMGKTTLLLRLKYEIENTPKLNSWLIPIFFNEESYDLTSLSNLWEKLLKQLDSLWETNGEYYAKTENFIGKPDYEKKCFDLLVEIIKSKKRKIVLFFDNFGQLFLDNLSTKDQQRLREVLMNCAEIRIIAASAVVLKDLYDYSKPFYEFFKIINLEGLNKDETYDLIRKLEEKSAEPIELDRHKAKIETLAILTGGVIRTIMLIYETILADKDGSALNDLETILDRMTPLYKHRIEDLPVQQRKVIDVIAKKWDAVSTKEIGENIRENGQLMPAKHISALLQQLEKNNVIEKKQTNTKNHLYQLKERFFNIWYLMRNGDRQDKCKVIWLTKFLELWYEDEGGFEIFLKSHISHLQSGKYYPSSAIMITEALANSNRINIQNLDLLLNETSNILTEEQRKLLPNIENQKIQAFLNYFNNEKYIEGIAVLNTIEIKGDDINLYLAGAHARINEKKQAIGFLNNIKVKNNQNRLAIGHLYYELGEYHKCINLIKNYNGDNKGYAYHLLGECYLNLDNQKMAINCLIKAIDYKNLNSYPLLIESLIKAKNILEAKKYCLEAMNSESSEVKKDTVFICLRYKELDKREDSKILINNALKINPNDADFNYLNGVLFLFDTDLSKRALNSEKYFAIANKLYTKSNQRNANYYICLGVLFNIYSEILLDKERLKSILVNTGDFNKFPRLLLYSSFLNIWENNYKTGIDLLYKYLNLDISNIDYILLNTTIQLLLSKKQFHSVQKIFETENLNLKERFKPIYYALMTYLKDEYPNEILKMGDELKQPVADVMKRVEEMAVKYA